MIRTLDGNNNNNVTVINFRPDDPATDWYSELLVANAHATHFRELLAKRIDHVKKHVRISDFQVDNIMVYYKLNYTLWKEEVERLNSLIQSYHIAHQRGLLDD